MTVSWGREREYQVRSSEISLLFQSYLMTSDTKGLGDALSNGPVGFTECGKHHQDPGGIREGAQEEEKQPWELHCEETTVCRGS